MTGHLSGAQIIAARALTGISRAKLAARAAISLDILVGFEAGGLKPLDPCDDLAKVRAALEAVGAAFLDEADGAGCGVRLKFSRGAARVIGVWEAEGGPAADDDIV